VGEILVMPTTFTASTVKSSTSTLEPLIYLVEILEDIHIGELL
jgi:hypothetical protein